MTILVVDDNEQNLYQLQVLLGASGHQVTSASNGADALQLARQAPPDVIVSDILMPVMDGFALCREWQKDARLCRVPFVFYTATYTDERDREFALSLGAARFLIKPEEPDVFLRTILEVIQQPPCPSAPPTAETTDRGGSAAGPTPAADTGFLVQYNEALVRRLEAKMMQLEETNRKLEQSIADRDRAEKAREKTEAQFLQAQKMEAVGRLAGGVAHDFNNMLQTILGTTELLLNATPADDPRSADLKEIAAAGRRSADLTRQLLAFARKQTIMPKVLDVNDTVADMFKMLKRLIGEDIDLLWKPALDAGSVCIDPSQLDQILANLVVNARDAIAGTGRVVVETSAVDLDEEVCRPHPDVVPGAFVMLAVSDNGCGMDKETQARVFEPFFTTKAEGKGTGLGLATVYGIVKQNNGFVNVYSEPGQGTTFRIYLPRHKATAAEVAQQEKQSLPATGTETVLLVEDEESLLRLGCRILEALGYTTLAAGSAAEALRMADEYSGTIHLLLTDVVMPGMSGRELSERLAAARPTVKCLYMSGYTADAISHRGIVEEGLQFIAKPFSRLTLATKLREVLDGKTG